MSFIFRVEGKSPGAVKFLIETGIESLLSLHKGDQIADFDYNSLLFPIFSFLPPS